MKKWLIILGAGVILLIIGAQSFYSQIAVGEAGKEIWGLFIGPILIIASISIRKRQR